MSFSERALKTQHARASPIPPPPPKKQKTKREHLKSSQGLLRAISDIWGFGSRHAGFGCMSSGCRVQAECFGGGSQPLAGDQEKIRKKKQGNGPNPRKSRQSARVRFLPPPKRCVLISCLSDWPGSLGRNRASCWPPFDIDCRPPTPPPGVGSLRGAPGLLRPRWARLPSARQTTAGLREAAKENR